MSEMKLRNIIFINLYPLGYQLPITPISTTLGQSLPFLLHFLVLPSLLSKLGASFTNQSSYPLHTKNTTLHIFYILPNITCTRFTFKIFKTTIRFIFCFLKSFTSSYKDFKEVFLKILIEE